MKEDLEYIINYNVGYANGRENEVLGRVAAGRIIEAVNKRISDLEEQNKKLREVLDKSIGLIVGSGYPCEHLSHGPTTYHHHDEECPEVAKYDKFLDDARELLTTKEEQGHE